MTVVQAAKSSIEESVEVSMVDREMSGGARSGRIVVVVVMIGSRGKKREKERQR